MAFVTSSNQRRKKGKQDFLIGFLIHCHEKVKEATLLNVSLGEEVLVQMAREVAKRLLLKYDNCAAPKCIAIQVSQ